jgi:hypothetical protein
MSTAQPPYQLELALPVPEGTVNGMGVRQP